MSLQTQIRPEGANRVSQAPLQISGQIFRKIYSPEQGMKMDKGIREGNILIEFYEFNLCSTWNLRK